MSNGQRRHRSILCAVVSFALLSCICQCHVAAFSSPSSSSCISSRRPSTMAQSCFQHASRMSTNTLLPPMPTMTFTSYKQRRIRCSSQLSAAIIGGGDKDKRTSTLAGPIFGVIKAMVGTGMLALPSGLAAVTNHPHGLWPAHVLLLVFSIISGYTFLLYGRLTHATQATSLGDIWKKVHAQAAAATKTSSDETAKSIRGEGSSSGFVVSLVSFVFCFGACLTFSLVFGDVFSSFLRGTSSISSVLPSWALTRQASILAITSVIIFPLCNLSSLAALAPVSILGVLGTVITTAFLAWRCPSVVSSSPYAISGLGLLTSASRQPSFSTYSRADTPAPLILIAMSCVALMAHFSAPDFYHAVVATTTSANTQEQGTGSVDSVASNTVDEGRSRVNDDGIMNRFRTVTYVGYSVVAILNSLTLAFGYLTFGGACEGIILNNYSSNDWGANVSRLLVGISVIGSYPFLMSATRSAALELFESGKAVTRAREFRMTSILLLVTTAISLIVKDAGFVLSFNGALMGSNIVYTIPALLFLKQIQSQLSSGVLRRTRLVRAEQRICRLLVMFGVVSAIVGGTTTVISSFFAHLLH